MKIYVKVRDYSKDGSSTTQQVEYIRHIIEDTCSLSKHGMKFKEQLSQMDSETEQETAILAYVVKKSANFDQINQIIKQFKLHSYLIFFISF